MQLYIENNIESWDTISQEVPVFQLAINEAGTNKLTLYPNPTTGIITLSSDIPLEQVTLKIYNVFGQLVLEKNNLKSNQQVLDLSGLKKGIYFIRVDSDKESFLLKLNRN